jgi:hypothetical protein
LRRAAAVLAACALLAAGNHLSAGENAVSDARVKAIAAMLPRTPTGFGRPAADRAAWAALAQRAAFCDTVRRAEPLLKKPLPPQPDALYLEFSRTGNRTRWQKVASDRRGRLPTLVLAECVENRGRFVPAIEKLLGVLSKERTWVMPAHDRDLSNFKGTRTDIDLASAMLGWNLATADWLLGEKLRPATRTRIRDNLGKRVFDPFRAMVRGRRKRNWWMTTTNNWNAVCLAGVTGAALAVLDAPRDRALFVAAAEHYSRNLLRGFARDGYCTEGVGYWNYGFGHYALLAESIHQATGGKVDLFAGEAVRRPALYGASIEIVEGICPPFADCAVRSRPDAQLLGFLSRRLGLGLRRWERPVSSARGSLYGVLMYTFPNSASATPPAAEAWEGPGPRTWFRHGGVYIGRPGTASKCRLAVALKGGHNSEHHNHNDIGSYLVVAGTRVPLVDPGAEVYTGRTFSPRRYTSNVLNSYGHPVPIVGDALQRPGSAARGRVVQTKFTDAADTLVFDIRSAYAVPSLKKLERTFVYSRKGAGSLTVTDRVVLSKPETFGTALVTFGHWEQAGPRTLLIKDAKETLRVKIDTGKCPFSLRPETIREDLRTRAVPTRIGIDLERSVTEATVKLVITPVGNK